MPEIALTFDYEFPVQVVYDWWTDLSGKGYIGRSLKSLRRVGIKDQKILVETRWKIMGLDMKMVEGLTLYSTQHWMWEPHMVGIRIVDDFQLLENYYGSRLLINSEFHAEGLKGKIAMMMFDKYLRKLMIGEWKSADQAFRKEVVPKMKS